MPEINLSLSESTELNAIVDPLEDPSPSQDLNIYARYKCGAGDDCTNNFSKTQAHDENEATKYGEKQSLVLNLKENVGIGVCGKNDEVLSSLKEVVSDIAKACVLHEISEEKESPDNDISFVCTAREEYAETSCEDSPTEKIIEMCVSPNDKVPVCIQVMEGCNSCSHIYNERSSAPKSTSETQTVNPINRSTVTETNTSTHRTCSSQTALQNQKNSSRATSTDTNTSTHRTCSAQTSTQGQRNSSVQTSCVQITQESQTRPAYTTSSCQTSISKSNNIRRIVIKPWAARKYQDMCMCAELGAPCTCANRKASSLGLVLPRNSSWWPIVKKTLLIIAALIPWIFLVVYSIYYYRGSY